jgi:hypothetical protein
MQHDTSAYACLVHVPWLSSVQLLKAVNKQPGLSKADVDEDAILLRAYGKGTDVLIDRESMSRSCCSHLSL